MVRSHDETLDTTTASKVRYKMSERSLCEEVENVGRRGALARPSLQDCERPAFYRSVVNASQSKEPTLKGCYQTLASRRKLQFVDDSLFLDSPHRNGEFLGPLDIVVTRQASSVRGRPIE